MVKPDPLTASREKMQLESNQRSERVARLLVGEVWLSPVQSCYVGARQGVVTSGVILSIEYQHLHCVLPLFYHNEQR
ncbi:MAG: hypothetical protein P8N76_08150 [Pirellulaceae bacterium]|nr:hypothetical protein [Pirellulaceae bacterium]